MLGVRAALVGLAAAGALAAAAGGRQADAESGDAFEPNELERVARAIDDARAGACDDALAPLASFSQRPEFDELPVDLRLPVLYALLECQAAAQLLNDAFSTASEVWSLDGNPQTLSYRLNIATEVEDPTQVAVDLITAVEARPELLSELTLDAIDRLTYGLDRAGAGAVELQVLTLLLEQSDWKPPDTVMPIPPALHFFRSVRLIEAGDLEEARESLLKAKGARLMIDVLSDKRFEPLWDDYVSAHGEDALAAAEAEVAASAELMQRFGGHLEPVVAHMQALRLAGRADEAVAIGQRLRPDLLGDAIRFRDQAEWGPRLLNELGYALDDAGDVVQSRIVLRAAAAQPENGVDNVSQAINAALSLVREGRGAEAVRALERVNIDNTAGFGRMFLLEVRSCGAALTGDAETADALLAEMLPRWRDNSYATLSALLCRQRLDDAAAITIEQLEDPSERQSALRELQIYAPPPSETEYERTIRGRFDALGARPDVLEAVERYGRILTWNIVE